MFDGKSLQNLGIFLKEDSIILFCRGDDVPVSFSLRDSILDVIPQTAIIIGIVVALVLFTLISSRVRF